MASSSSKKSTKLTSIAVCEQIVKGFQNTVQFSEERLEICQEQVVDLRELRANGQDWGQNYLRTLEIKRYFDLLNGPTYPNLYGKTYGELSSSICLKKTPTHLYSTFVSMKGKGQALNVSDSESVPEICEIGSEGNSELSSQKENIKQSWYLDNGCSRHMTGNNTMFTTLNLKDGGLVGFGGNQKAYKGIFIGYSERSKAYKVYNSETHIVEETMHVKFDDKQPDKMSELVENFSELQMSDDEDSEYDNTLEHLEVSETNNTTSKLSASERHPEPEHNGDNIDEEIQPKRSFKYKSSHPEELILGNKDSPLKTRSKFRNEDSLFGLISMTEPTSIDEVWSLVPKPNHKNIIGTKWSSESKGCNADRRHGEMLDFRDFVEEIEVVDVPVLGQWIGYRDISNHCPVWLFSKSCNWGPKPFRVINGWLDHPNFLYFVDTSWKSFNVQGKKAFVLKEKLKLLKDRLKIWNKEVFRILDLNIEKSVKEINDIEGLLEEGGDGKSFIRREGLNKEFWKQLNLKDSLLKQKSRTRWVKEGDSNSRYFHESIKERRRKNQLAALRDGDTWVQSVEDVKLFVKSFFHNNFTEEWLDRPTLDGLNFDTLSEEDNSVLMAPFSVEEARDVIWSSDGNKCPGPDMFNFNFLKVDFERAYDTVSWKYFEFMMIRMGFDEGWVKWMRACIFSSSMSVLVNKSHTEDFLVGKGLRQGSFHGYKVNNDLQFHILQFADDIVIVGIPVGANPRRKATWTPLMESMRKRLSSWNGRNLSIGV
ncbi:hypothetical protein TSUD_299410 [Trifolium subterraneum]|nr:hypothetical protein TSUD_299410 [Trifolium subterraneum]